MATVGVDSGSLQADSQPKSFGLDWGRRPFGAILHSSNGPGELSQWLCHDDSTINMVLELLFICTMKSGIIIDNDTLVQHFWCH